MANKRVLIKRRKSVRNIHKITRTMQLIATSRYQAAVRRATAGRPYTEKLAELVADLSGAAGSLNHPLMETNEDVKTTAVMVLTSNRGLCGGYNANVLRVALAHLDEAKSQEIDAGVQMVGKKGIGAFRFLNRPIAEKITHIGDKPSFEEVEPVANALIDRFTRGEIASAHVVYMKYLSAGKQVAVAMQLLPLAAQPASEGDVADRGPRQEFEFSPDPESLLNELLPASVRVQLFQCFSDATA